MAHPPSWHTARRAGIGGSDVASLLGLSEWTSPLELWERKTGRRKPDPGNRFTARGTELEPVVLERYEQATLRMLLTGPGFVRHPRWSEGVRLLANIDALHADDGSIVEAKTTGPRTRAAGEFREGRVPVGYVLQVAHYSAVIGQDRATVVCLIGDGEPDACDLVIVDLEIPAALRALVEDACAEWWRSYIVTDTAPGYIAHPRADEARHYIAAMWAAREQG